MTRHARRAEIRYASMRYSASTRRCAGLTAFFDHLMRRNFCATACAYPGRGPRRASSAADSPLRAASADGAPRSRGLRTSSASCMGRRRIARRFADTHLAADLRHLRSGLGLTKSVDNLRLGKLGCLHGDLGLCSVKIQSPILYFSMVHFFGRRSMDYNNVRSIA